MRLICTNRVVYPFWLVPAQYHVSAHAGAVIKFLMFCCFNFLLIVLWMLEIFLLGDMQVHLIDVVRRAEPTELKWAGDFLHRLNSALPRIIYPFHRCISLRCLYLSPISL